MELVKMRTAYILLLLLILTGTVFATDYNYDNTTTYYVDKVAVTDYTWLQVADFNVGTATQTVTVNNMGIRSNGENYCFGTLVKFSYYDKTGALISNQSVANGDACSTGYRNDYNNTSVTGVKRITISYGCQAGNSWPTTPGYCSNRDSHTHYITDLNINGVYVDGSNVKIDFNVYISGTNTNLSDINMSCDNNSLNLSGQTSPFSSTTTIGTTASCTFSKTKYDSNTQSISYDSNKTMVIYLKKSGWWNTDWNYRQALTLRTSQMGLGADVTQDHVILADINSTNTSFWTNVSKKHSYGNYKIWNDLNSVLTSYWKLDESSGSVIDSKGTNTGTNSGANVSQTGIINTSYGFDAGTNDNIAITNTTPTTISFWLYPTTITNYSIFFGSTGGTYSIQADGTDNLLIYDGAASRTGTYKFVANNWVYMTLAYTGTAYKIYINGKYFETLTSAQAVLDHIGRSSSSATMGMKLDEVTFFSSQLTDSQVAQLYQSYIGGEDIRFINKDNNVKLNWHYEDLNFDTNRMLAWVGVTDTFSKTTDYNINMYYGDSNVTSDINANATYNGTSQVAAFHLNNTTNVINNVSATGTQITSKTTGKIGNDYNFGPLGYITITDDSIYKPGGDFSIAGWINCLTKGGVLFASMGNRTVSNANGILLDIDGGTGTITYRQGATVGSATETNLTSSTAICNPGTWYFVTVTYSSSGTVKKLYINATQEGGDQTSSKPAFGTNYVRIGDGYTNSAEWNQTLNAQYDEIAFYNGLALSSDSIKLLYYNQGSNLTYLLPGPQENKPLDVIIPTKLTFNVYKSGTSTNLTAVDYDCTDNTLDLNNQTSPFTSTTNQDTSVACSFIKSGYDTNTQTILYDTNKTLTIYLSVSNSIACGTGGTTYDFNGYRIHRFDSNGTFAASKSCSLQALIIAGGGGGSAGGGGAGGLVYANSTSVSAGNLTVVVGAGGSGQNSGSTAGSNGNLSSFNGMTALGGGGGGSNGSPINLGQNGGSGGGGPYTGAAGTYNGGTATQGNSGDGLGYGNNGGSNSGINTSAYPAGGGGGAGAVGQNAVSTTQAGNGGTGKTYDINGTSICYAGGGGGAEFSAGNGGSATCGGGSGNASGVGVSGTNGTGGGGGGGYNNVGPGGNGGSGIVIIRYLYNPTVLFNVYLAGTTTNLTNVNIDCNGTAYDLNNQSSPFSIDMNAGKYSCSFSKIGYDVNTMIVDTNNGTINVYLRKSGWWDVGWSYKQPLILRTSQMSLSADVTQDHVILVDINSTDTNFWLNVNKPTSYDTNKYVWRSNGVNLDTNLMSYYKFDNSSGNLTDSKGSNTGTSSNITYSQPGAFIGSNSFSFNGSSSTVALANESNFDFERTTPFSISFWIKGTSASYQIISKVDNTSPNSGWEILTDGTGKVGLNFLNSAPGNNYLQVYASDTNTGDGKWHFVVFTYTGSSNAAGVNFYIDNKIQGKTINKDTLSASTLNNITPYIGSRNNVGGWVNGNIDEMAIWPNRTLTASEASDLYNSYIGINDVRFVNKDNNVKLNWHFEDLNFDTNRLIAWVGVTDTFSKTTDYNINMYYGNSSVSTDANGYLTYPSTYVSAYHLKTAVDAKGLNNGTVTNATTTTGKISGAYSFDGTGDYITLANESSFDFLTQHTNGAFSVITWVKGSVGDGEVWGKWNNNCAGSYCGTDVFLGADTKISTDTYKDNSNYSYQRSPAIANLLDNTWKMLTISESSGYTTITSYINTTNYTQSATTNGTPANIDTANPVIFGRRGEGTLEYNGLIDEAKFLNYSVSNDELKLLFNDENQNDVYLLKTNQQSQPDGNQQVTFNVYGASTAHTLITSGITMQCVGINTYDFNNQSAPKTITMAQNNYTCSFSRAGFDTNTISFTVSADGNVNVDLKVTNWWNMDWAYKQALTLRTSQMTFSADVNQDHAIFVDINSTNTNFWTALNRDGNSIRFINKDNNAKLNWYYEDLNFDSNRLLAWVNVTDTFPSATDLNINMYYGNSSVVTDSNSIIAYPSTYKSVWNMTSTTNQVNTSYNLTSAGSGTTLTTSGCKIGKCYNFNGSGYFTSAPVLKNNPSNSYTVLYWAKRDGTLRPGSVVTSDAVSELSSGPYGYMLRSRIYQDSTQSLIDMLYYNNTSAVSSGILSPPSTLPDYNVNPILITDTCIDSGVCNGWVNLQKGTDSTVLSPQPDRTQMTELGIGARGVSHVDPFYGSLDAIRIFNYKASDDEVKLLFYDENNNPGYLIKGAQESQPSGGSDPCAPPTNTDWNISTTITCTGNTIDIGTGALILSPGGSLKLNTTTLTVNKLKLYSPGNLIYIYSGSSIRIK